MFPIAPLCGIIMLYFWPFLKKFFDRFNVNHFKPQRGRKQNAIFGTLNITLCQLKYFLPFIFTSYSKMKVSLLSVAWLIVIENSLHRKTFKTLVRIILNTSRVLFAFAHVRAKNILRKQVVTVIITCDGVRPVRTTVVSWETYCRNVDFCCF